ncbi:MAG: TonB-dependent receptor [Deltaproteobacteria bacterium]|nr:TonB-dependent receptor [Deltaproteobacteria bacterium]
MGLFLCPFLFFGRKGFFIYIFCFWLHQGMAADLGEIRRDVEERPVEKAAEENAGFVTVIEVEEATERVETVPDLLAESVGVQIHRTSAFGGFSTLSIRGSASNQVAIYLDGVLLNPSHIGIVNLTALPLESLDRIEVYRGFSPVYLGSSAIGGVVNLVTREPKPGDLSNGLANGLANQLGLTYGSFETLEVNAVRSKANLAWQYLVGAHHTQSQGDFSFLDDNGTLFTTEDDQEVMRDNNDFGDWGITLKGGYDIARERKMTILNDTFYRDEGVPGNGFGGSFESTRLRTFRNITHLLWEERGLGDTPLDLKGGAYYLFYNERFLDREGEIAFVPQETDNRIQSIGGNLLFHSPIGEHQEGYLFLEFRQEAFKPFDEFATPQAGPESSRHSGVVAAQEDLYLFRDRLTLSPAIRYEPLRSDFDSADSKTEDFIIPYIGAKFRWIEGLDLRGNIGRYFRVPTFIELFGNSGAILGNDQLRPEEGINRDVGFRWDRPWGPFDSFAFEYAYFENDIEDLIAFIQNSQQTLIAINIGSADLQGHELSLLWGLWNLFKFSLNYTRQEAVNTSSSFLSGNRLPGRAQDEFYFHAEAKFRYVKPFYEFNFIGSNYLDEGNLVLLKRRFIHNMGITFYPKIRELSMTAEVKNVNDEQIADVLGFPLPGRSYYGTAQYKF